MNKVIVIGNGFDKAHGLATGYNDFIDSYWSDFFGNIFSGYKRYIAEQFGVINSPDSYEDEFVSFEVFTEKKHGATELSLSRSCSSPYDDVRRFITILNDSNNKKFNGSVRLKFKNKFFEHISGRCSLQNWVDIENEYYGKLKELIAEDNTIIRNEKVRVLNRNFDAVKRLLEGYLIKVVVEAEIKPHPSIQEIFTSIINPHEVAFSKQQEIFDSIARQMEQSDPTEGRWFRLKVYVNDLWCRLKEEPARHYVQKQLKNTEFTKKHYTPAQTLILNFNYTSTAERLYAGKGYEVVNIHGELSNARNPIIFGYGDELDEDYNRIEKLQDNDFLENIKSVRYHETGNYRRLLGFIDSEPYQVVTMGHSCGNSDRTLLNTLFEHPNCISVRVFYHLREDGSDDYSQLIRNLSRNFNDKAAMRDKVVNKDYCSPLVPAPAENGVG